MFGSTLKDKISNIVGFILIIGGAINAYLQNLSGNIDYFQLVMAVIASIVAYLTGKGGDAKPKIS